MGDSIAARWQRALSAIAVSALVAACATTPAAKAPHPYRLSSDAPASAAERERLAQRPDCIDHRQEVHAGASLAERQQAMAREVLAYQGVAEEALAMRSRAIRLVHELRDKLDRGEALSGRDLQRLNEGAARMIEMRAALFRISYAHECWLDDPVAVDPAEGALQATGIAMSLSSALLLYDNYVSAISLVRSDSRLRQHLNRSDTGFSIGSNELNHMAASFADPVNRDRVRRGLLWFETYGRPDAAIDDRSDEAYRYLVHLIEQSPSRQLVREVRPFEFFGNLIGFLTTLTFDTVQGARKEGMHVSSLVFGNAMGLVESRRGKLDGRAEVLSKVRQHVRAGDILLEKTPFRLTDAFIPGHFGHVAIWVGSEAELRQLGIWDHPAVRPHQAAISAGRGVVEALRSGVEMNPLRQFMNIDDLAVLRQNGLADADRAEAIVQALRQVGKEYDFNFEVQSTDRIVCSELVYHSYVHLDWPTERHLGRVTISPDNVAVRATGAGPLEVELLFHDGEEIASGRRAAMEDLVQAQVVRLARR